MKKSSVTATIMALYILAGFFIVGVALSAEEIETNGRFIAYHDGIVLDRHTNLMWAAKDNGYNMTRLDAERYCKDYRSGGYAEWRMPTQDELASLYGEDKAYKSDSSFDVYF